MNMIMRSTSKVINNSKNTEGSQITQMKGTGCIFSMVAVCGHLTVHVMIAIAILTTMHRTGEIIIKFLAIFDRFSTPYNQKASKGIGLNMR